MGHRWEVSSLTRSVFVSSTTSRQRSLGALLREGRRALKSWERNLRAVPHDRGQNTEIMFYVRPDRIDPTLVFFIGVEDSSIELSVLLPDDTVVTPANASSMDSQWDSGAGFEQFYACRNM